MLLHLNRKLGNKWSNLAESIHYIFEVGDICIPEDSINQVK